MTDRPVAPRQRDDLDWIVFDLGETLVDETRNWELWADHLGVNHLTFFAVMGAVIAQGRPHTDAFLFFRPDFSAERERPLREAAGLGWTVGAADLYPDALSALAELRLAGYRLAVMANQPLEASPFMRTLPVDMVATSSEWGLSKPDPRFFERVASELSSDPCRVAYIGDRVDNDVLPAKMAGMVAVHVRRGPWGFIHAEWPQAREADLRLDGLDELPAALDAIKG